ncbi:MAG: aminomethyl-transferring glycine dehydrogenase subunit GcvPA [Bradymonadaceae bacterium]|nr:aminomethyl-transferring glycine dehydrogenase subunit GcvPA [Lujinxingiaceae bacterium]
MRYIPHTPEDVRAMLEAIGLGSIDELFEQVPAELRERARKLELPAPMSEIQLEKHIGALASKNRAAQPDTISFMGAGLYEHIVPQAVSQLLLRAEFLTSYTPYQPEISQGTTKAIFEFQSMVSELLDMPIANASMYDGAHATAEAALMSQRVTRRQKVFVAKSVHPEYRHVVQTYLRFQEGSYNEFDFDAKSGRIGLSALQEAVTEPDEVACIIFQTPNFFGVLEDPTELVAWAHAHKIMVVACFNEPHAFAISTPPGSFGVDICAGEGMGLGVGLAYGGPSLGIFACREKHLRLMPGRLSGRTVDSQGREGYVLTLSTREQHIRREKATSNICTNQGLMALAAAVYLSLMGKQGLRELAELNTSRAHYAQELLSSVSGSRLVYDAPFFNEFVVELPSSAHSVVQEALNRGILAGYDLGRLNADWSNRLLIAVTETTDRVAIDRLAHLLAA